MVQREDRGKEKAPLKGRKEQPILLLVSKTLPGRKKKRRKETGQKSLKECVCVRGETMKMVIAMVKVFLITTKKTN